MPAMPRLTHRRSLRTVSLAAAAHAPHVYYVTVCARLTAAPRRRPQGSQVEDLMGSDLAEISDRFHLPPQLGRIIPESALPWYTKLRELADFQDLQDFYYLCPTRDYRSDDSYRWGAAADGHAARERWSRGRRPGAAASRLPLLLVPPATPSVCHRVALATHRGHRGP